MSRYIYAHLFERLDTGEFKELQLTFNNKIISLFWGQSIAMAGYSQFLEDNPWIKEKGMEIEYEVEKEDEFDEEYICPMTCYPYKDFEYAALRMEHCAITSSMYEKIITYGEFHYDVTSDMIKSIPEYICYNAT